jgi:hypothetical protein
MQLNHHLHGDSHNPEGHPGLVPADKLSKVRPVAQAPAASIAYELRRRARPAIRYGLRASPSDLRGLEVVKAAALQFSQPSLDLIDPRRGSGRHSSSRDTVIRVDDETWLVTGSSAS